MFTFLVHFYDDKGNFRGQAVDSIPKKDLQRFDGDFTVLREFYTQVGMGNPRVPRIKAAILIWHNAQVFATKQDETDTWTCRIMQVISTP